MLVKKKVSKTKTYIQLGVVFLIIGVTGYLLYTNLWASTPSTTTADVINRQEVLLQQNLRTLPRDFDKELFEEKSFQELRTYGNVPVKVRSLGKDNLFGID